MDYPSRKPGSLVRSRVVAVLVLLVAVTGCAPSRPILVAPPDHNVMKLIQSQLEARTLVVPPADPTVLAMVLTIPGPGEGNKTVSMVPIRDGKLGEFGLLSDTGEAMDRPGTYVEVRDGRGVVRFLAEIQDPRYSRGEGLSLIPAERARGELSSVSAWNVGGVLGLRIPFVPRGSVRVFTVRTRPAPAPNALEDALFAEDFPGLNVPDQGWLFEETP